MAGVNTIPEEVSALSCCTSGTKSSKPPRSSTGGPLAVGIDLADDHYAGGSMHDSESTIVLEEAPHGAVTDDEFMQAWRSFQPVGMSISIRTGLSYHQAQDLLQDVSLLAWRWLRRSQEIRFPGAFFMKILINQIKNSFRRKKTTPLNEIEVIDPTSDEANEREELEHKRWCLRNLLNACGPAERRAGEAFLQTGDHRQAVTLLFEQESKTAASEAEWIRRYTAYRTAMTRLRQRGRRLFEPGETD